MLSSSSGLYGRDDEARMDNELWAPEPEVRVEGRAEIPMSPGNFKDVNVGWEKDDPESAADGFDLVWAGGLLYRSANRNKKSSLVMESR